MNLLRYFLQARNTDTFMHPSAMRELRRSQRLIDEKFRNDPEANRIFLEILTIRRTRKPRCAA